MNVYHIRKSSPPRHAAEIRFLPGSGRNGGEGEIRTHVPELPDHPISSRRRYDHFGTSPDKRGDVAWTHQRIVKSPRTDVPGYSNVSAWNAPAQWGVAPLGFHKRR